VLALGVLLPLAEDLVPVVQRAVLMVGMEALEAPRLEAAGQGL